MKKLLLTCLWAASAIFALAQDRTISGKVTSADDGAPIPGVNVVVKGTTIGAITDVDGIYTISTPSSATTLVFTFIGLQTQEVEIGSRTTIDVGMNQDVKQLSEVIVTGYTTEKNYPGAATVIKGDIMHRAPVASFDQLLQGRVPGVLVNSGTGQPGSNATVRIRGVQSVGSPNTPPLYVVDGVPLQGDLSGINPNDIETTYVLKDAAAGALYGSRGSAGVIVITTKKGKAGENSIDFRTQYGVSMKPQPMNFKMMNTEQTLAYEETVGNFLYQTTGATSSITGPGWAYSPLNPSYAAQTAAEQSNRDALLAGFRANNRDFSEDLYRNGRTISNEVVARGGTQDGRYYMSFNAFNQEGFAMGSGFDRYTGRINIEQRLQDKFTMSLQSTIIRTVSDFNAYDGINSAATPFQIVWRAKPYEQVYKPDGTLDFGTSTALAPKTIANAIERQQSIIYKEKGLRVYGALSLQYDIMKGLSLKNNLGADIFTNSSMYEVKANTYSGSLTGVVGTGTSGRHNEAILSRQQLVNTTSLSYNNIFSSKHEVDAGLYFEAIRVNNNGFGYTLYNLDKRLEETGQGASNLPVTAGQTTYPQNAQGAKSQYGIRSYFATAKYTYDDKYAVNFSARQDGTSRILNPENKEIFTFSAGVNWNVINESFLQGINAISDLRVRATYGELPNINSIPTGSYGIAPTGLGYNLYGVTNYLGRQMATFGTSTAFAGSSLPGLVPTSPGNPDLVMERVKKSNVGFDLGLFNRATLVVDFYQSVTVDMFISQRLSATTGFGATNLDINAGQMTNKGVEISLSGDIYKNNDLSISANLNHAINVNNIDDLGQVDQYVAGTFIIKKGMPYGSHYTYNYIGADPTTGMPAYKNLDGSTVVTNTLAGVDQMATFGTFLPKHTGGFSISAGWKGFTVSTLFSYQFDVSRYNNVYNWVTAGYPGYINAVNQSTELLTDQWMAPGDQKRWASPAATRQFTSADVMDAKFLRWRELSISYTLPKIKYFKDIRVYARGQNLKIWSPWKGWDPEDNNNISLNEYPNPKMFVVGLDFTL
jgi:TonB-linked SusC/RagA family outer membrane protein